MKLRLTPKLMAIFVIVGLVPLLILASVNLRNAAQMEDGVGNELLDLANALLREIDNNFFERYGDVQAFASNPYLETLLRSDSLESIQENLTEIINRYVKLYGIYCLSYVTDSKGKILAINSVQSDGTPLNPEKLRQALGKDESGEKWFQRVLNRDFDSTPTLTGTVLGDVHESPLAEFIYGKEMLVLGFSAPILSQSGEFLGAWHNLVDFAFVENLIAEFHNREFIHDEISNVEIALINREGFIIAEYDPASTGSEQYIRNPEVFLKLNLVKLGKEAAIEALAGKEGYGTDFHNRKKIDLIVGYAPSRGAKGYPGFGWAAIVRAPRDEIAEDSIITRRATYTIVAVSTILLLLTGWFLAKQLVRPIHESVTAVEALAKGDLSHTLQVHRSDELGDLQLAVNRCIEQLRHIVTELRSAATELNRSSDNLLQNAQSQAAGAEQTTAQARTVAAAGTELASTAKNLATSASRIREATSSVAAASEEMATTIQEVSKNCSQQSIIAEELTRQSRDTRERVNQLAVAAKEIGQMVDLISAIAEQTNLLSLNATIEAASAGDAGKGFAVVAAEVKELARRAAEASEQIRERVAAIQQSTLASSNSLDAALKIISDLHSISSTIASAVEEQAATTSEIARNIQNITSDTNTFSTTVSQAASSAEEVSHNIQGVSDAAADAAKQAALVSNYSSDLKKLATNIQNLVSRFQLPT